ncbi:thermonuclease family protein [Methylocapsa sp. S129]|uniref:thermonuclease family protein n=1 Tax=Methylocapsa sp. S129 TaxID=1641869 RepID=UPI00131B9AC6|nr:thermonuclease family protein [Methylocapsa sp. S129]
MNRRAPHLMAPLLAAALLLAGLTRAGAACPAAGGERAIVASVTERGEITLADGRVARLAGLDIPDASRGDPESAAKARAWLSSQLVGREVDLRALAARTDRWGRLLADMSLTDQSEAAPASISLALLSAGLARVRPEIEARNCETERLAAEDTARADGLGLWTDPYYGVVEATDLDDLRQRDGQFAIVEGVVLRVGAGRDRTWLDFGRRGSFTAVVVTRQAKAFERAGLVLSALAGARIRVRGAMDNRFGLRMTISEPEQIEQLSQGAGASEAKPGK